MLQVQTLSTWYEMDYWTEMSTRWYSTIYYQMIIFLVGFIVSQLFIAVVCFGFENLEDQLNAPTFSDDVMGLPYIELEKDPEDALCDCFFPPVNPLEGAERDDLDRGTWDGVRVDVQFLYHNYAPEPLDVNGCFEPQFVFNPCFSDNSSPLLTPTLNSASGVCSDWSDVEMTPNFESRMASPALKSVGFDGFQLKLSKPDEISISATENKRKALSFVGSGSGMDPTPECYEPKPELDDYSGYRVKMAQWKKEAKEQQNAELFSPFQAAGLSEEPQELRLKSDDLQTWSNQRVAIVERMLRAQHEMHENNRLQLSHDVDGAPGELMGNELLADLVSFDQNLNVPASLTVHIRSFIRVIVEPLTNPNCGMPEFSLIGSETIGEVKAMAVEHMGGQGICEGKDGPIQLEHCHLYMDGETLITDEWSLWRTCLENIEQFDPMTHDVFFSLTIDKSEAFTMSILFDNAVIAAICFNAVFLSIDHYGASDELGLVLDAAEWFFNVLFTIEFGICVYCMKGFCNYWRFGANRFDCTIVCSAWINVLMTLVNVQLAFLRVLRIFRALRLVRILRKIESVKLIIDAAFESVQPIVNIMMFMLVVLTVYSCMGMQLYGSQFNFEDDEVPRENFDNFIMAFLGLFQVLSGSAWELVLYDCMRANKNKYLGVPFMLSFFILSNYIILNLFIGAILANMSTGSDEERLEMTTKRREEAIDQQLRGREAQLFVNYLCSGDHLTAERNEPKDVNQKITTLSAVMEQPCAKHGFLGSTIVGARFGKQVDNVSLGLFPADSGFRRGVYALVTDVWFDMVILFVIVYSTILLTFLNPDTAKDEKWQSIFEIHDIIFVVIFTVEFLLKLIAFGFIWCDNIEEMLYNEHTLKQLMLGNHGIPCYMYDSWNHFDLFVLVISYVNVFADPDGPLFSILRLLRLFRAFRPLRMINRVDGMKLVVMSLAHSVPALSNVCVLLFAVFLIFGILGLSLFMGKFHFCNDALDSFTGGSNEEHCRGHIVDGDFWIPKVWSNPTLGGFGSCSFDNIWLANMALFEVASGDSWETVMYAMADVPSEAGDAPYRDDGPFSNCVWALFCVVFVFVGQLFMAQLFVSVMIDSFALTEGSGLLTAEQVLMSDMIQMFTQLQPEPKYPVPEGWRSYFYHLFTDIRPLPIPGIQKDIDTNRVPQPRFVRDHFATNQQILQLKESLGIDNIHDQRHLAESRMSLQILEQKHAEQRDQIRVFEKFSTAALEEQELPDGIVYRCGCYFDSVLTFCILLNIACMCTAHHQQADGWEAFLWTQNVAFNVLFTTEMAIKLIGLGPSAYWKSPFDAFDGFIVLVSWIFIFVDAGAIVGTLRIGRVVKRAQKLQSLMSTLVKTLPSVANVFMVLLLVFFIFSVIAVELFGGIRYGFGLNVVANFGTWPNSMHTLWRAALGNWRSHMYDAMVSNRKSMVSSNV